MKLLIIALLSISTAITVIAPAFAAYEPSPTIGGPKRTGSGSGR